MENKPFSENGLNEKESLELIARMIQNTQNKLEKGAGLPFLTWGYATVISTIAVGLMISLTGDYHWYYLWFMIPVIGSFSLIHLSKKPKMVSTYVDEVVNYIWMVIGASGFILSLVSIIPFFNLRIPILFVILLIMAAGTTLTGLVIKFKPCVYGGIAGLVLAVGMTYTTAFIPTLSIFAIAFILMMIIPGHILNLRAKKSNS